MTNPVDDRSFMGPLIQELRAHVDAFAASMAGPKSGHGALEQVRPCAVAWVYYSTLVAWCEDHGLLDPSISFLRDPPAGVEKLLAQPEGPRGWLSAAFNRLAVHPATRCLLDPRYSELRAHEPGDDACRDLIDWWTSDAPSLAYDVTTGPASISGWIVGDLLQALSTERVKAFAFAQTPWWIADGIIDMTLIPAADTFRGETLKTIDPTCGTGHCLIRKIDYLWEWYTTGTLAPRQMKPGPGGTVKAVAGGIPLPPAEAIRRIIAGVDGCERDPLIAAVARLRFVVAIGELMHRSGLLPTLRLDAIPPFQPRIAVGDSLLAGKLSAAEYAQIHPKLAQIQNLGLPDVAPTTHAEMPAGIAGPAQQLDLFGEVAHA
jgi:hypothetical protein